MNRALFAVRPLVSSHRRSSVLVLVLVLSVGTGTAMGKKDKKKKTGAGAAKTADRTAKKDLKKLKKETGEDDIDAILSEITKKEASEKKVTITVCPTPPSARAT